MSARLRQLHRGSRRGAALLIALVALTGLTVAGAAAIRAAAAAQRGARSALADAQAQALLQDAEPMLLDALARLGEERQSQPGAAPFLVTSGWRSLVDVAERSPHEARAGGGAGGASLRAVTLDLSGRLHISRLGSRARSGLPAALLGIEPVRAEEGRPPVTLADSLRGAGIGDALSLYPRAARSGQAGGDGAHVVAAEWLTAYGSGALNINAAPVPLLEAALLGRDPHAAREALGARRRGEAVPAAALARLQGEPAPRSDDAQDLALTTFSDTAAILVEITCPSGERRRWWLVALRGQAPASERSAPRYRPRWPGPPTHTPAPTRVSEWRIAERVELDQ